MASATPRMACSVSASSKMMTGDFPPSSRVSFLRFPEAALMIFFAVEDEPVNEIFWIPGCSVMAAPVVSSPVMMLTTPGGNPAISKNSPNFKVLKGVCCAGLRMQVHPAARAGASFHAAITSGPFQGTNRPTTPMGSYCV